MNTEDIEVLTREIKGFGWSRNACDWLNSEAGYVNILMSKSSRKGKWASYLPGKTGLILIGLGGGFIIPNILVPIGLIILGIAVISAQNSYNSGELRYRWLEIIHDEKGLIMLGCSANSKEAVFMSQFCKMRGIDFLPPVTRR